MQSRYINIIQQQWKQSSDRVALFEYTTKKSATYRELEEMVSAIQYHFRHHGIQKGDNIILAGKSSIHWCAAFIAINMTGGVVIPLPTNISQKEAEILFRHSDAKLFVYSTDCNLNHEGFPQSLCLDKLETSADCSLVIDPDIKDEDLMMIIYTSGTTDNPKGVMLSYRSIYLNLCHAIENMPLRRGDNICTFLPLFHSYGCVYNFLYPFVIGATNIILDFSLTIPTILQALAEYHPTVLYTVPLVAEKISLMASQKTSSIAEYRQELFRLYGNNLKELVLGGAAIRKDIEEKMVQAHFPIGGGYGMTELGPAISYASSENHVYGSAGYIVDYLEAKLSEEKDNKGELLLKGDSLFLGYYKNCELTQRVIDNEGWFHTGDIAKIDYQEKGRLIYLLGRCKNILLGADGKNVNPEEIEIKINQRPYVKDSLVIRRGNALVALVYFEQSLSLDQKEQLGRDYFIAINKELPPYMRIGKFQIMSTDFNRTNKGTINRNNYS